jgi:hypothetical protein
LTKKELVKKEVAERAGQLTLFSQQLNEIESELSVLSDQIPITQQGTS